MGQNAAAAEGGRVRIIVPYTDLQPETVEAVRANSHGHAIHYVDVSGGDSEMWETWQWVWRRPEDTLLVEHDIAIHNDVIWQVEACDEPWCTFAYPYNFGNSDPYHGTGCVRFRRELMERVPDLWDRVGLREGPHHPPKHWCSLDGFSQLELGALGYRQCKHEPPVKHLDESNSHGCLGTF